MPLEKQIASIDFDKGLDARTAGKLVVAGKLTTSLDIAWKGKVAERRTGYTSLATAVQGGGNLANLKKGYTFASEIDVQGDSFWSWSPKANAWTAMGKGFDLNAISKTVIQRSLTSTSSVDAATGNGYTAYCWNETGVVKAMVVDETTGSDVTISGPTTLASSLANRPRVVFFNNLFMAAWRATGGSGHFAFSTFDTTNPSAGWTVAADFSGLAANITAYTDMMVFANRCYIAYTSGGAIKISEVSTAGAILNGPTNVGPASALGLAIGASLDGFIYVLSSTATTVSRTIFSQNLVVTTASATVDAGLTAATNVVFGIFNNATSADVFYSPTGSTFDQVVRYSSLASSGTIGTLQTFLRGSQISSLPFVYKTRRYIWLLTNWNVSGGTPNSTVTVEPSFVLCEDANSDGTTARMSAQASQGTARINSSQTAGPVPAKVLTGGNGFPFTVLPEQFILNLTGGVNTSAVGFSRFQVQPQSSAPLTATNFGGLAISAGGFLSIYDGLNPVELGFIQYPELLKATAVGSGGSLGAGIYQVALTYEWVDLVGNRWQSAATAAQSVTTVASDSITVTLPTLRHTNKVSPRILPQIVVWRTVVNGSILYRDTAIGAGTANSTTVDTLTYTITNSDTLVNTNEILYTTGALANVAPPAGKYIWSHQSRLWVTGMESPNLVWYSRKYVAGSGINFSDVLTIQINPWGGPNTGGASMDDKSIIFQQTATAFIYGDGPDNLGNNNSFSAPQLASRDIGCIDARTIAVIPFGVVFLSRKGFYLLDRGLQMHYFGAAAENLINALGQTPPTFTSTTVLTGRNQVRWTFLPVGAVGALAGIGNGITDPQRYCLVFDYTDVLAEDADLPDMDRGKWTLLSNYDAMDAFIYNDAFVQVGSDNVVCQDSENANTDTRAIINNIGATMETAWIKLSGVQNFQRVYRAIFAGTANGVSHTFNISVGFDYNPNYSYTFTTGALSASEPIQFRHRMAQQKCQAVRFKIVGAPEGLARWALENISCELGMKSGVRKLPAATSFT